MLEEVQQKTTLDTTDTTRKMNKEREIDLRKVVKLKLNRGFKNG